jgi:hypothetical protein
MNIIEKIATIDAAIHVCDKTGHDALADALIEIKRDYQKQAMNNLVLDEKTGKWTPEEILRREG